MEDLKGIQIGRYEIKSLIGSGGMAYVYLARDTILEREVAIKIIKKDAFPPEDLASLRKRFLREAQTIANLKHPNIVQVHDYGEFEGAPYLVMELIPGVTLRKHMVGPIPYPSAVQILIPISDALAYVHQRGVLHRDIKPENIIIRFDGIPILMDFGIAKAISEIDADTSLTNTGAAIGTPDYMAPEQSFFGKIDKRTDEYALSCIFYEMITGKKPFQGETREAVRLMHYIDPVPSVKEIIPEIPDQVEIFLQTALAKNPDDRFQDMEQFSDELRKLLSCERSDNPPLPSVTVLRQPYQDQSVSADSETVINETLYMPDQTSVSVDQKDPEHMETEMDAPEQPSGIKDKRWLWLAVMAAVLIGGFLAVRYLSTHNNDNDQTGIFVGSCSMESYLNPGDHAEVVSTLGVNIRKEPAGELTGIQAFSGKDIEILEGPICVDGVVWFKIDFLGYQGWSVEGQDGIYFLRKTEGIPPSPEP